MNYGYARVSSQDQNLERQTEEFLKFGIDRKNIYSDKKSGKDFDRAAYSKLMRRLRRGDVLVVKSIDRLGRNYAAIIEEWHKITHIICADIVVLDMPLLDTRAGENSLMGRFIADVVLQILSFVAENERVNIRTRQAEGIAAAKARGVRFGRPPKPLPENFRPLYQQWKNGRITCTAAARLCGMPLSTFRYRAEVCEKASLL